MPADSGPANHLSPHSGSESMDKSMMPILVALVAIAAVGAAVAICGEAPDGGNEIPSGYPPSDPGYNTDPVVDPDEPIKPEPTKDNFIMNHSSLSLNRGDSKILTVLEPGSPVFNNRIEWSVTDDSVCELIVSSDYGCDVKALASGTCTVRAVVDSDYVCICFVTVSRRLIRHFSRQTGPRSDQSQNHGCSPDGSDTGEPCR